MLVKLGGVPLVLPRGYLLLAGCAGTRHVRILEKLKREPIDRY